MAETLPPIVFDAWLRSRGVHHIAPIAGGLSGALVFRAVADGAEIGDGPGQWAVRGWPEGVSLQRVAEVHRVAQLARRTGCRVVPAIEPSDQFAAGGERPTQVMADGRVWECCQWMPGRPPEAKDDLVGVLREAADGVARFHRAVASLGEHHGPVPAVRARLQRLAQLDPIISRTRPRGDSSAAVERALDCLRQVWSRQWRRAARLLQPWADRPLRQQYVFRDVHLENALFVDGRLSGIIDCDAIRIDSPATDLARLVGSAALLRPSPAEGEHLAALPWSTLWSETLAAYRSLRPFSTEEAQLARILAEVSPLIALANWVVWVVHEGRSFPGPAAVVDRRIDAWTRVVHQQFEAERASPVQF